MRVLVTGAAGQLGRDLVDALSGSVPVGGLEGDPATGRLGARLPLDVVATDVAGLDAVPVAADHRVVLDITDRAAVRGVMEAVRPDVVIHGAAWTAVDACESDPDRAFLINALGTRHMVEGAGAVGAHLVYISTDYVFDGTSTCPYREWDTPNPLSVYGRSKWGGEMEVGPGATIVRTSWVSGAHGANIVGTVLRLAAGPGPLRFIDDQVGSPTFTADLAGAVTVLATERLPGIFHVTNQGVTSWYEFAGAVLAAAGHDPALVEPIQAADLDPPRPAPRPAYSVLDNGALRLGGFPLLPDWHDALGRLVPAMVGAGAHR